MKKILIIAILLVAITGILSIYRFGLATNGIMQGDGSAVLQATTVLLGIWALAIGFGITIIGASFHLSKLPSKWKFKLFSHHIIYQLLPFIVLAFLSGLIPFWAIFNIDSTVGVLHSPVAMWLGCNFIMQTLLIISAVLAAYRTYEYLSILPAIKATLKRLNAGKLIILKNSWQSVIKKDMSEDYAMEMMLMSGFGRDIVGEGLVVHEDLLLVFETLFQETNPQNLESGIRLISDWLQDKSINELDSYFQYRLVPACFLTVSLDKDLNLPVVFKIKIYYLARLIEVLRQNGCKLTAANSANPIWRLIYEYSLSSVMDRALEQARMALDYLLNPGQGRMDDYHILLGNLLKAVPPLLMEGTYQSLSWIDKIFQWHRLYLECVVFTDWIHRRGKIEKILNEIEIMYRQINEQYHDSAALIFIHDLRHWIIIGIRRIQEAFVQRNPAESIDPDHLEQAASDFDYFNNFIEELININSPPGNPDDYAPIRYPENPYIVRINANQRHVIDTSKGNLHENHSR